MSRTGHVLKGKVWKFADDIMNDGGLMHHGFVKDQEWNPEVLKHHCLQRINPDFAKLAKPGDILVAGKRFGHGNPHIQGFLGLKGLGVGLVVESMPRGTFRLAINAGVYVLPSCIGITQFVENGELLEVDYENGKITNMCNGKSMLAEPVPQILLEIIDAGGGLEYIKKVVSAIRKPSAWAGSSAALEVPS